MAGFAKDRGISASQLMEAPVETMVGEDGKPMVSLSIIQAMWEAAEITRDTARRLCVEYDLVDFQTAQAIFSNTSDGIGEVVIPKHLR